MLWLFQTGKTRLAFKRVKQRETGNVKNCLEFHITLECPTSNQGENL